MRSLDSAVLRGILTSAYPQPLDHTRALDALGGPLHASGLPECDQCSGEILDTEAIRLLPYVDDHGNETAAEVGDCCALTLIADVLERHPGGSAEAWALRALREIASEHEQGIWTRG